MAAKKQCFTLFSICVILHVLLSKGDGGSRICAVGKVLDSWIQHVGLYKIKPKKTIFTDTKMRKAVELLHIT
jgi:hypothetical protein